jgi:glycosyltransferase involved in cell wall biosynthesis
MTKPRFLFLQRHHYLRAMGGAEIQCWMMATELARRGWDVHYASEMNELIEPNPLEGVTLHGLPEKPPRYSCNRKQVHQLIQDLQPDVILNQVLNMYTVNSIGYTSSRAMKIYLAAHDLDGFTMGEFIQDEYKYTSFLRFLKHLPFGMYMRVLSRHALRKADLILAQHKEQQEKLLRSGIRSMVLRNCHPLVSKADVQTHEGEPLILWVSSIKGWKRPQLFIELAKRCQDLPAKFMMIGAFQDQSYKGMVEDAVKSLKNFEYGGFVAHAEVGKYFSQAHLFVSTSISEGFSNTFIQAWIRGVPVLSIGVDPENLMTEQGLGVCTANIDELEKTVRELVANTSYRRAMGARAWGYAQQEFELGNVVSKLESMIREHGVRTP